MFIVLGILAIASGIITISAKNPLTAALSLVFHFFMLAGLYLTLNAQFVAVIQVLVYAGAIMVLVVFVIMLLNLGEDRQLKKKINFRQGLAILFSLGFVTQLFAIIFSFHSNNAAFAVNSVQQGTAEAIGNELYTNYLFPFEAISILLLAAIIGAVVLAKRKIE